MKNKFIKLLANLEGKKDQKLYALLTELYSKVASMRDVYHYQLGYTPSKYENLVYAIKKDQNITDKEIALYQPGDEDDDEENTTLEISISGSKTLENVDTRTPEDIANQLKQANPILAEIHNLPDVQTGLKLRDEYPFLDDENTPEAIKALVTDKFTAYRNYAALHAEALEAANETEAADKLYELASEAVKKYQLNIDIKDEFDHYRDTEGKVLGNHPKLKDLRIEQEVDEMSEADLIKHRVNAMKAIPKYDPEAKPEKFAEWTLRLKLAEKNLLEKFNRTFEKK